MKLKNILIIILSIAMIGLVDNAEAQKRKPKQRKSQQRKAKPNKYKKRKAGNKKLSSYRGRGGASQKGVRGGGSISRGRGFEPHYFAGVNINAGNYFGDVSPTNKPASTDFSSTKLGFGFYGGYTLNERMAVTAGFNFYRVSGDDFSSSPSSEASFPRYQRNLSFRNDIKELRASFQLFLIPDNGRRPFNAYVSAGLAVFHHEPKGKVPDKDYQKALDGSVDAPSAGQWVKLRPLGTEGQNLDIVSPYKPIGLSIPIALGVQVSLPTLPITVGFEVGIRYLFTDYIDDISTKYVSLDRFTDDLARIMSDKSTVPISTSGEARNLTNFALNRVDFEKGSYFIEQNVGTGVDGSIRGGTKDNDVVLVTQLKVSYRISGKKRAKRR